MKKLKAEHAVRHPHVRKGDVVKVIAGEDRGRSGKVLQVFPVRGRALVEGINLSKKHMRKSQDNPQGGIVDKEAPIALSNLKPVRETDKSGEKAS
ncbi:MAG: 50S ribosomal protein L24 [Kiritimatiellia bacterium]|nr:50S ribosomal protein L24 [Kiritimatiellia bacterium]